MGDLLVMDIPTLGDIPVERICDAAKDCTEVLIIGREENGARFYASSYSDGAKMLWEIELLKQKLLNDGLS